MITAKTSVISCPGIARYDANLPWQQQVYPEGSSNPTRISLLSWNIAYARGPETQKTANFRKGKSAYLDRLERISSILADIDLVMLQEVDFASHRSYYINQAEYLQTHAQFPYAARIVSWDCPYVPYPPLKPLKHYRRVKSGGLILSRFPITAHEGIIYRKPKKNSLIYNHFYISRYTHAARITLPQTEYDVANNSEGQAYWLLNTHFEAFDINNRMAQAMGFTTYVANLTTKHPVFAAGGDYNALRKETTRKHGFADGPDDYRGDKTIEIINQSSHVTHPVSSASYVANEPAYLSFPSIAPSRGLDHIFLGNSVANSGSANQSIAIDILPIDNISDHRPVKLTINP